MNLSFYSAAAGAHSMQSKLDVIANNLANVSTAGYRSKTAKFSELLYENIRQPQENPDRVRQGSGSALLWTGISFENASFEQTGGLYDFAISGEGLFAVKNMTTEEIFYTRAGGFHLSQGEDGLFYLAAPGGELVLDSEQNPVVVIGAEQDFEQDLSAEVSGEMTSSPERLDIGIFDFANKEGFIAAGGSLFRPHAKNGDPFLVQDSSLERGFVEASNVDLIHEITGMIEAQRLYQMSLRMVQTSDEIEATVNSLR